MGEPDGRLLSWDEIADACDWQALLLGNGLSMHVWERFAYRSLFEQARAGGLTAQDEALFKLHGGENFERVLADLRVAMGVADVLELDRTAIDARYASIRSALGRAVREVHLDRQAIPDRTLRAIREELARQQVVFTTSYDLLIYWAMGHGGSYKPFVDSFRGRPCRFTPFDASPREVPVYYLHGALHLIVEGSGLTQKLRGSDRRLLAQFGEPIPGDPEARPLLITEGSWQDKLLAIEENAYLAHALRQLREWPLPIVVFGSGLSEQDDHLVEALNEHEQRAVAVSMRPVSRRELLKRQSDVYNRLAADPLLFFDATTHPLGQPRLRAAAVRKAV